MKTYLYLTHCLGLEKPSRFLFLIGTPAINPNPSGAGQTVNGTVTANQGTANATPWNENIAQVGGTNVTLGQKVMASSIPVVLASDQASVPVAATLNAETTKVIGVVRNADGSGNLLTSTTNALDINLKTSSITLPISGTVIANAGTGTFNIQSNASVNVAQLAGTATSVNNGTTDAGTLRVTLSSDSTGQVKLATGANTIGALSANQSVNVAQINGVTPLMGNGVTGTGSQRVTIASDNTAFSVNATLSAETTKVIGTVNQGTSPWIVAGGGTAGSAATGVVTIQGIASMTKLLVTPDSVALPANQSVNVAQLAGTTTSVNNGTTDAGTLRVTLSSDSTGQVKLATGANTIGALTANQSVNVAQINAVTPLMGNGTTGTGSQRVTLASDSTGIANYGHGATGSAVPAGATYKGGLAKTALPTAATDGNLTGAMMDKFGRQITVGGTIRDLRSTQTTTITSSTSETTVVTAGASGVFNDIEMFVFTNTSATGTRVDIRDATAGSVIFSVWVPATDIRGFAIPGETLPQTTAANNWTATCGTSISDLRVFAIYEKNK